MQKLIEISKPMAWVGVPPHGKVLDFHQQDLRKPPPNYPYGHFTSRESASVPSCFHWNGLFWISGLQEIVAIDPLTAKEVQNFKWPNLHEWRAECSLPPDKGFSDVALKPLCPLSPNIFLFQLEGYVETDCCAFLFLFTPDQGRKLSFVHVHDQPYGAMGGTEFNGAFIDDRDRLIVLTKVDAGSASHIDAFIYVDCIWASEPKHYSALKFLKEKQVIPEGLRRTRAVASDGFIRPNMNFQLYASVKSSGLLSLTATAPTLDNSLELACGPTIPLEISRFWLLAPYFFGSLEPGLSAQAVHCFTKDHWTFILWKS